MLEKAMELIENERARHEGRYHDAGMWFGLNWVLEEAQADAERTNVAVLDAVGLKKASVIEDLRKAKEELRGRKVGRVGRTAEGNLYTQPLPAPDGAKASFLAGELEGLEKAIEILKEA